MLSVDAVQLKVIELTVLVPAVSPVGILGAVVSLMVNVAGVVTDKMFTESDVRYTSDPYAKITGVAPVLIALKLTTATN